MQLSCYRKVRPAAFPFRLARMAALPLFLAATVPLLPADSAPRLALQGVVVDSQNVPVPGAAVRVEPAARTAVTGSDGRFRLEPLLPGRLVLTVTASGFFSGSRLEVDLSPETAPDVEITLQREGVLGQSVVVTGSGIQSLLVEAPVRTELLTQQHVAAQAVRNLAEALTASLPGVRIENNCQNCGWTAIRMNGLEGPYTQILEDGLPTVSGASMVYALDQLPTEFFENIEVVKGGASSLYGPNAVAGVVNLVRREPNENRLQLDAQSGFYLGRPEHSGGIVAQRDNIGRQWAADFYYRGYQRTHNDIDRDGFTDLTRRVSHGTGGTLFRRFLSERARLTTGASFIDDFRRGGDHIDNRPEQTAITEQIHSNRFATFVRWNHTVAPSFYYNLSTSLSHLQRHSYYGAGFDPNAYGATRNPLSTSDASAGWQSGRHTVSAGFQHWYERIEDVYRSYNRDTRQSFRNSGLYLQDEWRITRRITLLGGFRGDKSNLLGHWVLSPRGNVRIGLTDALNLRIGLSTGFRPPQVFDEDLHIAAVGGEAMLIRYAQGLRHESSRSLSAALDYTSRLAGRPLQLGASFFWTRLNDVFQLRETFAPTGTDRILERTNGPGSRFRGIEFNGLWRASSRLALRAGGTFQTALYDQPEPIFASRPYLRTPNRYGYAGVDFSLPLRLELLNSFEFTGSMLVPHYAGFIPQDRLERSSAFHVWNFVLSRTWDLGPSDKKKVRLYLRGNNVLDSFQKDFDQGPERDSTFIYGPLTPRGLLAGLTFSF